jgi:hypothetical protein
MPAATTPARALLTTKRSERKLVLDTDGKPSHAPDVRHIELAVASAVAIFPRPLETAEVKDATY